MLVLTILAFTAVLALGLFTVGETLAGNRNKILAALGGHSQLSQPVLVTRPVSVRVVSRRISRPVTAQAQLRAAA